MILYSDYLNINAQSIPACMTCQEGFIIVYRQKKSFVVILIDSPAIMH